MLIKSRHLLPKKGIEPLKILIKLEPKPSMFTNFIILEYNLLEPILFFI